MGLDMFLFATGKNYRRTKEVAKSKADEYTVFLHSLYASEKCAPIRAFAEQEGFDIKKCTEQQINLAKGFQAQLEKKAKELGGTLTPDMRFCYTGEHVDEIAHLDSNPDLHDYIVKNWGDPKNDTEEIYLDESALKAILEKYDYCAFRIALYVVRGGGVVFYRAV